MHIWTRAPQNWGDDATRYIHYGSGGGNTGVPFQGYLAHKNPLPPRTLLYAYAKGPMVVLGGGHFLMSELPLYRGSSPIKKVPLHRTLEAGDVRGCSNIGVPTTGHPGIPITGRLGIPLSGHLGTRYRDT